MAERYTLGKKVLVKVRWESRSFTANRTPPWAAYAPEITTDVNMIKTQSRYEGMTLMALFL